MPELPEVECVRRTLLPHLLGRRVESVRIRRADVCECFGPAGRTLTPRPERLLKGEAIASITRHGKQLAIVGTSGRAVCFHLGMSGSLCVHKDAPPADRHNHVEWTLNNNRTLAFRDPRRFGGVWSFEGEAQLRELRWNHLGPDALTITGQDLALALHDSTRALKAGLLDQAAVAGVGNIYADEALFRVGLRPQARCSRQPQAKWDAIAQAVREVLAQGINSGGSTLRDYVNADGSPGSAQALHSVYGRAGEPCVRCGECLSQAVVAQRTTVWCPVCQRLN